MARGKVKIQYIENNSKRNTTLRRRLKCLITKVNELSILCHVVALLVVFRNADVQQPEVVWPSMERAVEVAGDYMAVDTEKLKKALDGPGFVRELVDKERARVQNFQRAADTKRCIHDLILRRKSLSLQGLTLTPQVLREHRNLASLQDITDVQCKLQSTLRAVSDQLKEKRSGSGSTSAPPPQQQQGMMLPPAGLEAAPMAPMEVDPPHVVADAPMAPLGGFFFDEEDDFNFDDDYDIDGDGGELITPEELRDILAFVRAGTGAPPPPNDN